jgi:glycosyltransferase involved in cell wall biosynthesis
MNKKIKKLLFITPNPVESASERYRIYQFLPYLERAGFACTVRPFATEKLYQAIQADRIGPKLLLTPYCCMRRMLDLVVIPGYDVTVIQRGVFPFLWPALEGMFVRRHGKVVFDVDDAIHIGHRNTSETTYSWVYKLKYGPGVNETLRHYSHIIAGNKTLAEHALHFNSQVTIVPTVVDLEKYTYQAPRVSSEPTIGWIGSRSTSQYLLDIEPALRRLSETHAGRIRFRIYGHPSRRLNLPNFESLPFSLMSEIDNLRTIDIGIMPIPDNDWTRGKCAFKAIQYMALGIPAVTSPVGMATELIQHGVNGYWARTSEEWFEALNRLVLDAQLRKQFSEEGRETVEACYSLQTWAPVLADLFTRILQEPRAVAAGRTLRASN